jgi:hypothetical protein
MPVTFLVCNMRSDSEKSLFSVLDIWASVFISKHGKALIVPAMISALESALDSLPSALKRGEVYSELEDYFSELKQKYDDFELLADHPFNTVMCEFIKQHKDALSEDGRKILKNVQELLGVID